MVHTSCPPTPGLFSSLNESPLPGKWPSRAYAPSREHREPVLLRHMGGDGRLEITSPELPLLCSRRTLPGCTRCHHAGSEDLPESHPHGEGDGAASR